MQAQRHTATTLGPRRKVPEGVFDDVGGPCHVACGRFLGVAVISKFSIVGVVRRLRRGGRCWAGCDPDDKAQQGCSRRCGGHRTAEGHRGRYSQVAKAIANDDYFHNLLA